MLQTSLSRVPRARQPLRTVEGIVSHRHRRPHIRRVIVDQHNLRRRNGAAITIAAAAISSSSYTSVPATAEAQLRIGRCVIGQKNANVRIFTLAADTVGPIIGTFKVEVAATTAAP